MNHDARPLSRREALAALAGAVLLPSHAAAAAVRHERHVLFGSPVDVMLRHAPGESVEAPLARVMRGLQHIHVQWNAWKPGELGRINQAFREGRSVRASPALLAMLGSAARLEQASAGFFNPAIGGAVQFLGIDIPQRAVDTAGWLGADFHVHSGYSFDSDLPPQQRLK